MLFHPWLHFDSSELSGKIGAFLGRAHRYGLAGNILTVSELLIVLRRIFSAKSNRPTAVFILWRKPRV